MIATLSPEPDSPPDGPSSGRRTRSCTVIPAGSRSSLAWLTREPDVVGGAGAESCRGEVVRYRSKATMARPAPALRDRDARSGRVEHGPACPRSRAVDVFRAGAAALSARRRGSRCRSRPPPARAGRARPPRPRSPAVEHDTGLVTARAVNVIGAAGDAVVMTRRPGSWCRRRPPPARTAVRRGRDGDAAGLSTAPAGRYAPP